MKTGVGMSRAKDAQAAVQEAYRQSLQRLGALNADFSIIVYTYDYVLEPDVLSAVLKRVFKNTPHIGCSTWSAWNEKDMAEGENGIFVLSIKDIDVTNKIFKVHSLKEKGALWAGETIRFLDSIEGSRESKSSLFLIGDGIHFSAAEGFRRLREEFPKLQVFGFGTSYGIPQCSLVHDGEIYSNSLIGVYLENIQPWVSLLQNIWPEGEAIDINRMSENLLIEIDEKPAFYRLCEHLMAMDDLPMMSPDEFRKHMGNLYIVETPASGKASSQMLGQAYRVVSLLGSEMTTGMVAVGEALDFSCQHHLGQKKVKYIEDLAEENLMKLKECIPEPQIIWMLCSTAHFRDKERTKNDLQIVQKHFPGTPIFGVGSHGEYYDGLNHQASLIIAFE